MAKHVPKVIPFLMIVLLLLSYSIAFSYSYRSKSGLSSPKKSPAFYILMNYYVSHSPRSRSKPQGRKLPGKSVPASYQNFTILGSNFAVLPFHSHHSSNSFRHFFWCHIIRRYFYRIQFLIQRQISHTSGNYILRSKSCCHIQL